MFPMVKKVKNRRYDVITIFSDYELFIHPQIIKQRFILLIVPRFVFLKSICLFSLLYFYIVEICVGRSGCLLLKTDLNVPVFISWGNFGKKIQLYNDAGIKSTCLIMVDKMEKILPRFYHWYKLNIAKEKQNLKKSACKKNEQITKSIEK